MTTSPVTFRRFECKYIIGEATAAAVRRAILPYVAPDPHASPDDASYEIRSLYLDAPDLRLFWETQEGISHRLKLRVRDYPAASGESPVFLEIKRRFDRVVLKDRAAVDRRDMAAILSGGAVAAESDRGQQVCREAFQAYLARWYARPMVWISYRREAYAGLYHQDVRITFDRRLRCAPATFLDEPADDDWRSLESRDVVLELKFDNTYPRWLQALAERLELQQRSYSKYGTAIRRGIEPWRLPAACAFGMPRW